MAEKPKSVQEKVTIRPRPIAARVIQRVGVPHIDKGGELCRLLELGFAPELTGFSLDVSTLSYGGRVWDLRPELEQNVADVCVSTTTSQALASPAKEAASVSTDPRSVLKVAVAEQPSARPDAHVAMKPDALQDFPLRANLRGLSGDS